MEESERAKLEAELRQRAAAGDYQSRILLEHSVPMLQLMRQACAERDALIASEGVEAIFRSQLMPSVNSGVIDLLASVLIGMVEFSGAEGAQRKQHALELVIDAALQRMELLLRESASESTGGAGTSAPQPTHNGGKSVN